MKKARQFFRLTTLILTILFGLYGCNKDKMDRYEDPPWLGGSSIETLQKKGNYTIYLRLMEKANYKEPMSKQLFTLFVPDDEAFNKYFQSRGIASVEDLSEDESVELFTNHFLRNPRSSFQLIYEYAYGELQGPNGEYASWFYRKPCLSFSTYYETVKYEPTYKGQTLLMYTGTKFVPLITKDFIEDSFGEPDGSDYSFNYPASTWGGLMQWHNAMVIPQTIPATVDNLASRTADGFIYYIDQVVPPMPSIEQYLKNNPDTYGLYYDIAQRFAQYAVVRIDEQDRQNYGKFYRQISNIAAEGGPFLGALERNMRGSFTTFIPTNEVLQNYLDNTVFKYYNSIDSVPEITLYYILQSHINMSLIGQISKITKLNYNYFGDVIPISKDDIATAYTCSNGVVYQMKRVLEPNVFTCVPGRLFFDGKFSAFLQALNSQNMLAPLSNPDIDVTLFAPTNEQLEKYNIRYNDLTSTVEWRGSDLQWVEMNQEELLTFINDHIYIGKISDLSGDGFIKMSSGNYIHYSNNVITSSENNKLNTDIQIDETLENPRNGMLYIMSDPIKTNYKMGQYITDNPEFSLFAKLMVKTELLDTNYFDAIALETIPNIQFLNEVDNWTAFFPDNNAVNEAIANNLDTADVASLKNFILYHFVRGTTIFDDGKTSGSFPTSRTTGGAVYSAISIANSQNNLIITDHSGQQVPVDHANANVLVRKGVVHKITSVLNY
jgi:uncharacterized surface protein with fasciclin (FAS1) repeats